MRIIRSRGSASEPPGPQAPGDKLARAKAAFEKVYFREYSGACKYVWARTHGPWAEDLVQDAFLRLWGSCYEQGDIPHKSPRGLLYQILRDRIADHLRSVRTRREFRENLDNARDEETRIQNQTDAARVADGNLLQARVQYIVAALPEQMQKAYRLSEEMHRNTREIAETLEISQDTARYHVWLAKKRIEQTLLRDGYLAAPETARPGEPR